MFCLNDKCVEGDKFLDLNVDKCSGCGVLIQYHDPKKLGYIPPDRSPKDIPIPPPAIIDEDPSLKDLLAYTPKGRQNFQDLIFHLIHVHDSYYEGPHLSEVLETKTLRSSCTRGSNTRNIFQRAGPHSNKGGTHCKDNRHFRF